MKHRLADQPEWNKRLPSLRLVYFKRPVYFKQPGLHFDQKLISDLSPIRPTRLEFFPKINKRPGSVIIDWRVQLQHFHVSILNQA